jgi:ribonuclease R
MRKERERNGAIGFDTEEVRFRLDEDGSPIEAYVKERKDAHLLIEDFMLLANKEVALYMDKKGEAQREFPFIYRVHDLPNMEKVVEFARFAYEMGHPMKVATPKQIAESYNALMRAAQKDDRLKVLEPLAIRTMAKAVYSANNIGHYGLGYSHYTHFTSPIRRYADVLAHRLLERNLDGRNFRMDKSKLEEQCKHISTQEKKAADAERESIKYKQAELLRRHLGEVFEGYVSGMIDRGFFVELPGSLAEGLVEFRNLSDTYFIEEGNLRARSRRSGHVIKMGDKVQVRVTSVDLSRRQIEMELV